MTDVTPLVEVRIVGMRLDAYREVSEHTDELLREFALVQGGEAAVPRRLLELMDRLTSRFSGFTTQQENELRAAIERGERTIDLVYHVPADVKQAAMELGVMLDEADDFCRHSGALLTLAAPPRALAFRRWFLDQFIRQVDGAQATPWEDPQPPS